MRRAPSRPRRWRGRSTAGLPAGEVTHVIVTSDAPFSSRFLFRIYVTAPNGSDYVVATIDVPASHHGMLRPDRKYCSSDAPARLR